MLLQTNLSMPDIIHELNSDDLISWIGRTVNDQKMFHTSDFTEASAVDSEAYFPLLISKTLKKPHRFTLFGIVINELHIRLDKQNRVVALFLKLDNQNLVDKMIKAVGDEYMASSVGVGDAPIPDSHYLWDFKGGCVSLNLNANKIQFKPKLVRDDGLIIFSNCDPLSYIAVPAQ